MSINANEKTVYPKPLLGQLRILMRSGNSFDVDGVEEWEIARLGGKITEFRLKLSVGPKFTSLIMDSLDLSQVEAIVILPTEPAT